MSEIPNITLATSKGKRRGTLTVKSDSIDTAGFDFKHANKPAIHISVNEITDGIWLQNYDSYILKLQIKNSAWIRLIGLRYDIYDTIDTLFKMIKKSLRTQHISTRGTNIGEFQVDDHNMSFLIDSKLSFEVGLNNVVQTVAQGRNELAFEFTQDDNNQSDQLYEMRVWVPEEILEENYADKDEDEQSMYITIYHIPYICD